MTQYKVQYFFINLIFKPKNKRKKKKKTMSFLLKIWSFISKLEKNVNTRGKYKTTINENVS